MTLTLLAIDWASTGIKAAQFVLSFSILVVLHEMGHFFPARWFKCRVEKFYLFFNPWFSLWKKKIGETEYGIGWVPFGGFVKIAGMIDESMDKEQMKLPPQPYEFRAKPAWQRLIIMTGGVIVNVILAIVIFICITWVWGEEKLPMKNLTYGVYADSIGKRLGVQDGDRIVALDGKPVENFGTLEAEIVFKEAKQLTVLRNNEQVNLNIPSELSHEIKSTKFAPILYPRVPAIVDTVFAKDAKFFQDQFRKGDRLIAINNQRFEYLNEFVELRQPYYNTVVEVLVQRGADTVPVKFLMFKQKKSLGFRGATDILALDTIRYTFAESISVGFNRCWNTLNRYIMGLKRLFNGKDKASESLGSVVSIGNTFPGVWDWERFWELTAIFSIILAFMNILPIPALDGGHALFTLYEMVTGRKPSDKFMEYAQMAGMILLLGLMAYALGLDFWRLFK